jgi:hypothetical protein
MSKTYDVWLMRYGLARDMFLSSVFLCIARRFSSIHAAFWRIEKPWVIIERIVASVLDFHGRADQNSLKSFRLNPAEEMSDYVDRGISFPIRVIIPLG